MIGTRLRVARARMKLSMRDLAARVEVSANAIKKYEANQDMPGSRVLMALCRELDMSIEWIACQKPLDFHSSEDAPQGRHAKYWVRAALDELADHEHMKNI